ncbi:hypothetical protein [Phytohabitans aurantiacus]|uniref:Uncharacterized protein n=1 Tax=Phytohabitans aurantiacus TaxID=3016789 RepID=A0ABQ5R1W8_9ACTN|nr:hypothetical protein [Phytohabitans aurantiacus]GLI00690.1 hypothetical protein Pa4123_59660 [Phytohabitans aurantiacus]
MGETAKWIVAVFPWLIPLLLILLAWGLHGADKSGKSIKITWNLVAFHIEISDKPQASKEQPGKSEIGAPNAEANRVDGSNKPDATGPPELPPGDARREAAGGGGAVS